ncbi:hypothetical protein HAX54_022300, partial [Datura stramonium]|nr:hypothetical protein [Datura stramonium]
PGTGKPSSQYPSSNRNPGTSPERVVIAGLNIINTTPTNIDVGFKPPGLRWMGREVISTSQLQQMRNSKSGNL